MVLGNEMATYSYLTNAADDVDLAQTVVAIVVVASGLVAVAVAAQTNYLTTESKQN